MVPRGHDTPESIVTDLIQSRADAPEVGDGEGLLLRRFPSPLVAVVPDESDHQQWYFISCDGNVWTARFDRTSFEWKWSGNSGSSSSSSGGGKLKLNATNGEMDEDTRIDSVVYHRSRRMLVWTELTAENGEEARPASCAIYAQHLTGGRLAGSAQQLLRDAPAGELRTLDDAVCFFPRRAVGLLRDIYTWTLDERLKLHVHLWGVGALDTHNTAVADLKRFESLYREVVLPAMASSASAGGVTGAPGLLCTASHPNNGQLLVLDPSGLVSAFGIRNGRKKLSGKAAAGTAPSAAAAALPTGGAMPTAPDDENASADGATYVGEVCRLKQFKASKLGKHPTLLLHRHTIGVAGTRGTTLHLLANGAVVDAGLSVRREERAWHSVAGAVPSAGVWSPNGGVWVMRSEALSLQASKIEACAGDRAFGKELAAKVCSDWQLDCLAGRYALGAMTQLNAQFGDGSIGSGGGQALPTPVKGRQHPSSAGDGAGPAVVLAEMSIRSYVERVCRLLPYVHAAAQSPAIFVAMLSDKPQLHKALEAELAAAESHGQTTTPLNQTMLPLLDRYVKISATYRAMLTGQNRPPDPPSEEEDAKQTAETVLGLLAWKDSDGNAAAALSDASDTVRATLEHHVRNAPADVLQCILKHLHLPPNVVAEGFPAVADFATTCDAGQVGLELHPDAWDGGQQLGELRRENRHPLYEILCRLLYTHAPTRLLEFIRFCAQLNQFGGTMPDYAHYCRAGSEALPNVPPSTAGGSGGVSQASAVAHSQVVKHAGDLSTGLVILLRKELWTDAVNYLATIVQEDGVEDSVHLELFRKLLGSLVKHGQLERFAERLFVKQVRKINMLTICCALSFVFSRFPQKKKGRGLFEMRAC